MRRRVNRAARVAALVVFLVAGWPGSASAEVELRVDAGFDGYFVPGTTIPVRVRMTADILTTGTLRASAQPMQTSTDVEVAAGSPRELLLFLPMASGGSFERVVVELRESSGATKSTATDVQPVRDTELVGLLPGVLATRPVPGPAPLAIDAGTARFVELDDDLLADAPEGLGSLSTIGAAPDELERLPGDVRRGLLAWVADGGHLLVDAATGDEVAGLPEAWQPGNSGRTSAGLGEVVAADGAMAAGQWAGLIEPTSRTRYADAFIEQDLSIDAALASEAGLRPPNLDGLVMLLALYAVVAGPLTYIGLRMRRREVLAWVVVPVLALLFAGGSFAAAQVTRGGAALVHGTVLRTGPDGGTATTFAGVTSPSGGRTSIGFPGGFDVSASARFGFTSVAVVRTPDGRSASVPLNPGQLGTLAAGSLVDAGVLAVEAFSEDGGIRGTVTNHTGLELEDVTVLVGRAEAHVGNIAPGDAADWQAPNQPVPQRRFAPPLIEPGGVDEQLGLDAALRNRLTPWNGTILAAGGRAIAIGSTRDHVPELEVDGRARRPSGTTLVFGAAPIVHRAGDMAPAAVRVDEVRGSQNVQLPGGFGPGFFGGGGDEPMVMRLTPPDGADPALLVRSRRQVGSVEVWRDDGWQPLDRSPFEGEGPGAASDMPEVATGTPLVDAVPPVVRPRRPGGAVNLDTFDLGPTGGRVMYIRVSPGRQGWIPPDAITVVPS